MNRMLLSLLTCSVFLLTLVAGSAAADPPTVRTSELPTSLRYMGSTVAETGAAQFSFKPRAAGFSSLRPPSRYRTKSFLRYSAPLGDTGLVMKVKLPLKPRKIIMVELRF
jgi:hypothetical protein